MSENPYESPKNQEATENEPAISTEVSGMKAREIFGIIVRTIGFSLFVVGVDYLWGLVIPPKGHSAEEYLKGTVAFMGTGFLVCLGADKVVAFAYWRNNS